MKNMKVFAKLIVSFLIITAFSLLLAGIGIFSSVSINGNYTYLLEGPIERQSYLKEMQLQFTMMRYRTANYAMEVNNPDIITNTLSPQYQEAYDTFLENLRLYEQSTSADTRRDEATIKQNNDNAEKLANLVAQFKVESEKVREIALSGNYDAATTALRDVIPLASEINTLFSDMITPAAEYVNSESDAMDTTAIRFTTVQAAVAVVCLIISLIFAFYISGLISKPLIRMKNVASEMASGNINIQVDYKSKDEIGGLADAFRSVIESLNLLNDNMKQLKGWATEGLIMERAKEDARIKGAYKEVVEGVNGIMDTFANHFNSIPVGVAIVDTSRNKLFENKTAAAYKSIDADNIQTQTKDFADDTGRTVGSLVITIDQTTVMEAQRESERQAANVATQMKIAEKQAEYQAGEVEKLIDALDKLARGNLNISVVNAEYDEDTKAIYENFKKLGGSLQDSCANIRGYIDELDQVLGSVSNKDLSIGIDREYLGDFATLKTSINNITDTLNEIFGEIASATDQVQGASQQVANSSQNLAQGSSEQASAVEEISATIAEVSAQTKSNAENASKANDISLAAKKDAETGNRQMDEMVNAMEAIKEASKGIASIIKVIEDIAFQTNILALNAAVEAARAGEHGKGFAVVAEEVRTLAARSAAAAKETTEMIDNSLARVEVGSKIAGETASALGKIVEGVTGTVDIVSTIAEASTQQAIAIAQIDNGIEQISTVTQSNTATAEESASASQEMAGQAQMLQQMIGAFNLRGQNTTRGNSKAPKAIAAPSAASVPKFTSSPTKETDIEIYLGDGDFGKY